MSHLEDLIHEYLDWSGYLVRHGMMVGKLAQGGWEMELDLVAYNPHTQDLIHCEPSLDAHSWDKRAERYEKKFSLARKHLFSDVFSWLPSTTPLRQIAVFISRPPEKTTLSGGEIISIDELILEIKTAIKAEGIAGKKAIPERYPLLRTMQLTCSGYSKKCEVLTDHLSLVPLKKSKA